MNKIKKYKILRFGVKNLHKRIYIKENIQDILENLNAKASSGVIYGQIGVLDSFTSLKKSSHIIHKFYIEDNFLMADIEILDNEYGKILKDSLNDYVFRPTSAGTIDEQGVINIKKIITVDAVLEKNNSYLGLMD